MIDNQVQVKRYWVALLFQGLKSNENINLKNLLLPNLFRNLQDYHPKFIY